MPKKDYDGEFIISETGNWNVAAEFSKIKIMAPLAKCDIYEDVDKFGYESIADELIGYNLQNDLVRFKELQRVFNELLKICKNSKFALKKGKTKEEIDKFEKLLIKIDNLLPPLITIKFNQKDKTKIVKVNEQLFNKTLNLVLEVKSKINEPLNKNHLIFTDKEDFDPIAYKNKIIEDATNKG